ncbi:MAG: hypothetical protein WAL32_12650, partial [Terriglobales bacterium]
MGFRKTAAVWTLLTLGVLAATLTGVLLHRRQPITLKGAVLRQDSDPNKQSPIGDVEITATNGIGTANSKSDPSGFFRITLPKRLQHRQPVTLEFRHKDYQPLTLHDFVGNNLYIVRMSPLPQKTTTEAGRPPVTVSNARVRYSVKATTEANVGST